MSNETQYIEFIKKSFSGEISEYDRIVLETWLEKDENVLVYDELASQYFGNQEADVEEELQFALISNRLNLDTFNYVPEGKEIKFIRDEKKNFQFHWGYAAAVIICFAMGYFLFKGFTIAKPIASSHMEQKKYNTTRGEKTNFTLSDGTNISLNAGSLLNVIGMEGKTRDVRLKGEAYFKVSRNEKKPFIIHTDLADIKVLGTSFNVKSYSNDKLTVGVTEGKVQVIFKKNTGKTPNASILTKSMELTYKNQTVSVSTIETPEIENWIKNKHVFISTPFSEIITELERSYAVDIQIENNALKDCIYKAKFENLTINQVLLLLQRTGNFKFKNEGKKIRIWGGGCNQL